MSEDRDKDVKPQDIAQAERELAEIRDDRGTLENLGPAKVERMRRSRARKAARRRLKRANEFDKLIRDAIGEFCAGHYDKGAEAVEEIAGLWKSAGLPKYAFLQAMESIEKEVVKIVGLESVRFQIHDALKAQAEKTRRIVQ